VRVYHPAIHSHSFVAHLSEIHVPVGKIVEQGQTLGASGSTGNSTGPHLHFELRAGSQDAYYENVTFGYTQGRYNPIDAYVVTGSPLSPGMGR
jgi:murein DD-endopeptidase MepM/ murein hydrolase activator NlpD